MMNIFRKKGQFQIRIEHLHKEMLTSLLPPDWRKCPVPPPDFESALIG